MVWHGKAWCGLMRYEHDRVWLLMLLCVLLRCGRVEICMACLMTVLDGTVWYGIYSSSTTACVVPVAVNQ